MTAHRLVALLLIVFFISGCGGAKSRSSSLCQKGLEMQRQGKPMEAQDYYRKAIKAYWKNIQAHQRYQDSMIAGGRKEEVLGEYRAKLAAKPGEYRYEYLYGRLLKPLEGKAHFQKCISMNSHFAWGFYGLGLVEMAEGKYQDALASLEQAVEFEPDDASVHLQLGRVYATVGRLSDSEKEFRRVVEIDRNSADGYFYIGNVSLITGNINEAFNNYTRALEIDPGSSRVLSALGKVSLIRGSYDKAITLFCAVEKKDSRNAWTYLNIGRAFYLAERPKDALAAFRKALSLSPDMVETHYIMALAAMDQHRWEDGSRELAIVEKKNRNYPGLHKARALIALARGNESDAERELSLEEKVSRDPEIWYIRGQIMLRRSQALKAEEQFQQALALDSRYYPAYLGLGQVEEHFHEYMRAVRVYEEALVLFPDDVELLYRMGSCYSLAGNEKQAVASFTKSFECGMDDWERIRSDRALQGLDYLPEIAQLLKKYRKTPGAVSKHKHSQLSATSDLIYNQLNRAYRKM